MQTKRYCNRCNALKAGNARCEKCGCPEFRIDRPSPPARKVRRRSKQA